MNTENQQAAETLREIKTMMEKSSRFISLSGMSGIIIGITTIISVSWFCNHYGINPFNIREGKLSELPSEHYMTAFVLALVLLSVSLFTSTWMSVKRAKKQGMIVWGPASKQLLINMMVPLGTGIVACSILFFRDPDIVLPLSLIFYGISLYNAGKFTHESVRFFGLCQIFLGLISMVLMQYHIIIWTIGFGLLHVIYGAFMSIKHQ